MILDIDSNIVFNTILKFHSKIGQLIINSSNIIRFFTVSLLKEENERYNDKLLSISGFTDEQYQNFYKKIIHKVNFFDDILIPNDVIKDAIDLVTDIHENDILFVALSNNIDAKLWIVDKKFISGLKIRGYSKILTTNDMCDIFLEKQVKSSRRQH